MALGQIVALVMVNKCVKFHNISFNSLEVMTKVKVFHADDTRVMAISRLFFPKTDELKMCKNNNSFWRIVVSESVRDLENW